MSSRRGGRPPIKAVVAVLCGTGEQRYAVTYPKDPPQDSDLNDTTSITFSLSRWEGGSEPEPGQVVMLFNLKLFSGGWRANGVSPVTKISRKQ